MVGVASPLPPKSRPLRQATLPPRWHCRPGSPDSTMPVAAHGRTVGSGIAPGIGKAAAALRQVIPWGRVVSDLSGWAAVRRQDNRPLGQLRVEPLLEALPGHVIHWAGDHHPFGRSAISIWGSLGAACVGYRIGHGRRTACEHNECHDASHETGALQLHPCGWMIHSGTLCPCKLDALIWVKPRRRYAVAVQQCAGECRLQVARPALVSVRPTQQARDRMVRRRHLGAAVAVVRGPDRQARDPGADRADARQHACQVFSDNRVDCCAAETEAECRA